MQTTNFVSKIKVDFILKQKYSNFLILFLIIVIFTLTSSLVPNAAGPDAGMHMTNTYCANGSKSTLCKFVDNTENIVYRNVNVPYGVHGYAECFAFSVETSAACAEPFRSSQISSISLNLKHLKGLNQEILFVQRIGRDVYSGRIISDQENSYLVIHLNHLPISSAINLTKLEKDWYNERKNRKLILTFIPSLSTRNVSVYVNGTRVYQSENKFKAYQHNSFGNFKSFLSSTIIKDEDVKQLWQQNFSKLSSAYTQEYNPPIIYKFLNLFMSNDVYTSYLKIKIINLLFVLINLIIMYILLSDKIIWKIYCLVLLITCTPYGFYLFGTNNTSSYVMLGVLTLTTASFFFKQKSSNKQKILFVILMFFNIFLVSARTDGFVFLMASLTLMGVYIYPLIDNYKRFLFYYLSNLIIASYFYANYKTSIDLHAGKSPLDSISATTLHNLLEINGVILGLQGFSGPLGIWGFSLVEKIPQIVFLSIFLSFSGLIILAWSCSNLKNKIILILSYIIIFFPFAITLSSRPEAPAAGGWMMPRYAFTMYSIFVLFLILTISNNKHLKLGNEQFLKKFISAVSVLFSFGLSIGFYFLATKNMNGLMVDYQDSFLPNIFFLGDWVPRQVVKFRLVDLSYGWVPYLNVSINLIIIKILIIQYYLISKLMMHLLLDKRKIDVIK